MEVGGSVAEQEVAENETWASVGGMSASSRAN